MSIKPWKSLSTQCCRPVNVRIRIPAAESFSRHFRVILAEIFHKPGLKTILSDDILSKRPCGAYGALAQLVGRGKRTFAPNQAPNHLLREQEIFGFAHLLSSRFAQPTGI